MLADRITKIKHWYQTSKNDLYVAAIIFLVGMTSFGLGRLSAIWPKKEPVIIDQNGEIGQSPRSAGLEKSVNNFTKQSDSPPSSISASVKGKYVASKNGAAYHFPWCAGALKIKEENKIWFQTKEEAEKAGYKPAGNCEGL